MSRYEVLQIWERLLTQSALMHATWREFPSEVAFVSERASSSLRERQHATSLEGFALNVTNLLADLAKELLILQSPQDFRHLKSMGAQEILDLAFQDALPTPSERATLKDIRRGRDAMQHGYAFVAAEQSWHQIFLVVQKIGLYLDRLQQGFGAAGISLEMDYPEFPAPAEPTL